MSYQCRICRKTEGRAVVSGIRDWEYGAGGTYEFMECLGCRQVQLHPFPTMDDLKLAYPESYPAYIENLKSDRGWLYSTLYRLHTALLIHGLKRLVPRGAAVLDVGCGNGDFLCFLRQAGAGALYGIDFSARAAAIATSKGIIAKEGLFLDYQPPIAAFDMVVMNHYIEHVLDPPAELKKVYTLLKSGGVFHGTLPNFDGLDRLWFGKYWGGNHVPRHTFQYTPALLAGHLRAAGFSQVRIRQDMNTGHLAISLQNWLQRHQIDLASNPRVRHGRMKGFGLLLLAFLPLNLLFVLCGRSGVMTFDAVK